MTSELWQRIRSARTAAGLKQQDLAAACGVTRVAVGHWEAPDDGRRTIPSLVSLRRISEITGAPFEWLASDESEIHKTWVAAPQTDDDDPLTVLAPLVSSNVAKLAHHLFWHPDQSVEAALEELGMTTARKIVFSRSLSDLYGTDDYLCSGRTFVVAVNDGSCAPHLLEDDLLSVNVDCPISHGDWVLARVVDSAIGVYPRRLLVKAVKDDTVTITLESIAEDFIDTEMTLPFIDDVNTSVRMYAQQDSSVGHPVHQVLGKIMSMSRRLM